MKYVNAKEVLPPSLLHEVQQYLCGELLYIPKKETKKAGWGQKSGARLNLSLRNRNIIEAYQSGTTIYELMDVYCLSEASIRKIIYSPQRHIDSLLPTLAAGKS